MMSTLINGKLVEFKLDSGAEISVLGERAWRQLGKPAVRPIGPVGSYGTMGPMIGRARVRMSFAGRKEMTDVAVARGLDRISLFGRDLIDLFKLENHYKPGNRIAQPQALNSEVKAGSAGEMHEMKSAVDREGPVSRVKQVLARHEAVFAPGRGRFKLAEANLSLVAGSRPRMHKPRRVPPALLEATDGRLAKLLEDQILKPVKWAEWGTPLVLVPKTVVTKRHE
uniref:Peptidase A2 domain-containing protein n=1 Tax=Panagrellus redivivus TaxID=6233 RepID=A0A7E4UR70_PANRE